MAVRESEIGDRIDEIYDEELWRAHEMSRARLIRALPGTAWSSNTAGATPPKP